MTNEVSARARRVGPDNRAKWSEAIMRSGFCSVPNLLLAHQRELGLSTTEMCVLLQILRFWWFAERAPFPSVRVLQRALPIESRAIQRAISKLETKGFLVRKAATSKKSPEFDLSGLRAKLEQLAADKIVPLAINHDSANVDIESLFDGDQLHS